MVQFFALMVQKYSPLARFFRMDALNLTPIISEFRENGIISPHFGNNYFMAILPLIFRRICLAPSAYAAKRIPV
jgi:hypothetical protein